MQCKDARLGIMMVSRFRGLLVKGPNNISLIGISSGNLLYFTIMIVNVDRWMDGWIDGWVGGRVGGWMGGWMDG